MNAEASAILLVDDEELNSEGLARRLQRHDCAVTVARSGREAIELLGRRRFDLVLLDVNGHGVAAALLWVTASHLLARMASPPPSPDGHPRSATIMQPAKVAAELGERLSGEAAAGQTFTLLYGVLDLDTREFRFVCAGHPGPVHLAPGSPPAVLETKGFPVGVGTADYREQTLKLQPGARLVLYSDGVTEARNADGEHFGTGRLLGLLEQTRRAPLGDSLNTLLEKVDQWRGGTPPHDDIAILATELATPDER